MTNTFALWLIIALAIDRVYLKLVSPYYNTPFSASYGALTLVQERKIEKFIGQRILVPALIYWIERLCPWLKPHRLTALYEPLRIGALALALYVAALAIGTPGALVVAALLPASFLFDYFDFPYEILGFAAALTGNLQWAILGGGLHALARAYTAPAVPVTYLLVTGDWFGAALIGAAVIIGLIPGQLNVRDCHNDQPFGVWKINLEDARNLFKNRPFYLSEIFMSMGLSVLILWAVLAGRAGPAWPIPLLLLAIQWTLPRAAETRTLAVALLWVVPGLLR